MPSTEQLTIRFKAEGQGELKAAFTALNTATSKLANSQRKLKAALKKTTKKQDEVATSSKKLSESWVNNFRNSDAINSSLGRMGKKLSGIRSKMLIVAFAVGMVGKAISKLNDLFAEFQKQLGIINAVLESTNSSSGKTSEALVQMANDFQSSFAVANTEIMKMQSKLLTFTNIVGSTFNRASEQAMNLSTVFGQDLSQSTIQLGKALNDPIRGYTALRRIGISFSEAQVQRIKGFQEEGDIIAAQNVILKELEREMGDSAKQALAGAYGNTAWKKSMNDLSDAGRELGLVLQPLIWAISKLISLIGKLVSAVFGIGTRIGKSFALANAHTKTWGQTLRGYGAGLLKAFTGWETKFAKSLRALQQNEKQMKSMRDTTVDMVDSLNLLNPKWRKFAETNKLFVGGKKLHAMRDEIERLNKSGEIEKAKEAFEKYNEVLLTNNNLIQKSQKAQEEYATSYKSSVSKIIDETLKLSQTMGDKYDVLFTQKMESLRIWDEAKQTWSFGADEEEIKQLETLVKQYVSLKEELDDIAALEKIHTMWSKYNQSIYKSSAATTTQLALLAEVQGVEVKLNKWGRVAWTERYKALENIDLSGVKLELSEVQKAMIQISKQEDAAFKSAQKKYAANPAQTQLTDANREKRKDLWQSHLPDNFEKVKEELLEGAKWLDAYYDKLDADTERRERKKMVRQKAVEAMQQVTEAAQERISASKEAADAEISEINRVLQHELDALRQSFEYRKANDKKKKLLEDTKIQEAKAREEEIKERANKEMKEAFRVKQLMDISETVMSTQAAVMKTLAKGGGFFSTPLAMVVAAMGAASIATIASQKPPTMQYGGLVGGKRHSQGGTMVEAEQGEYVVSRGGVDAIGLETLNKINRGKLGGGAGSNIIINNPILSKDLIEDQLVPEIKEALRRGGDIGIG